MFDGSPKVLLIEDDPVFRQLMVAYLELWGARVLEADNGAEGLLLAEQYRPDLVLSELLLPAPAGQELIGELKRRYPWLPVIAVSGLQKMADVARALRAGAEDYLIKPVRNWKVVEHAIAACLCPQPAAELAELAGHLAFYRRRDVAATRLVQGWRQQPERLLDGWRLSCRQNSPWVLTEYLRLEQDLLLLVAEFDPLHSDTPVMMTLVAFLLHEPLRRHRDNPDSPLLSPARTLEYINQLILDAGLDARVNLVLVRLNAGLGTLEAANGGMAGCDWLDLCNAGPLGGGQLVACPHRQRCSFPLRLSLKGGFGGEIEVTASPLPG